MFSHIEFDRIEAIITASQRQKLMLIWKDTIYLCLRKLKLKMDHGSVGHNSWKSHKTSGPADFRMALWILKLATDLQPLLSGHIQIETNIHALEDRPLKAQFQQSKYQGPCFPTERWLVWLLMRLFALSPRLDPALMSRSHSDALLLPLCSPKPASSSANETSGLSDGPRRQNWKSKAQATEARGVRWICQGRTFPPTGIQMERGSRRLGCGRCRCRLGRSLASSNRPESHNKTSWTY